MKVCIIIIIIFMSQSVYKCLDLRFQEVEAPRFQHNRHIKVVNLTALRTGRLYTLVNIPDTHFCSSRSSGRAVYGVGLRPLAAAIVGLNPAGGIFVFLLCVVR
jgi:hypothetical protein